MQIARTVTSDQTTLTMQDVSPSTLYFSDRPERVIGQLTTEQFVEQWTEGPNIFFSAIPLRCSRASCRPKPGRSPCLSTR